MPLILPRWNWNMLIFGALTALFSALVWAIWIYLPLQMFHNSPRSGGQWLITMLVAGIIVHLIPIDVTGKPRWDVLPYTFLWLAGGLALGIYLAPIVYR